LLAQSFCTADLLSPKVLDSIDQVPCAVREITTCCRHLADWEH
jgi:hypothetical protein